MSTPSHPAPAAAHQEGAAAGWRPAVTVVVPSFNARSFIARAIDSGLAQSMADMEILVIDDASTDGTPDFVAATYAQDGRVRVLRQPTNKGPAAARNVALREARGTWVALLDADDAWRPNRLEAMLSLGDDADAIFDNLIGYDAHAEIETGPLFPTFPDNGITIPELVAPTQPGSGFDYGYLKPLLRRSFVVEHLLGYDETLRGGEDLLFYLALLSEGARTRTTQEPYYLYTTPVGQASRRISPHTKSRPRDDELRAALDRARIQDAAKLDPHASEAISQRIAFLKEIGALALFYDARLRGHRWTMASLFLKEGSVRRDVWRKLVLRFVGRLPWARPRQGR